MSISGALFLAALALALAWYFVGEAVGSTLFLLCVGEGKGITLFWYLFHCSK
jgi:hypothetical protein